MHINYGFMNMDKFELDSPSLLVSYMPMFDVIIFTPILIYNIILEELNYMYKNLYHVLKTSFCFRRLFIFKDGGSSQYFVF